MTDPHAEARRIAEAFHEAYERLAPDFGYKTREASAVPWADVPEQNKALMIAVAGEVLSDLVAREERLREVLDAIERIADYDRGHPKFDQIARLARHGLAALSTPEADDGHARAEHLREAREVEAWQEAKHARREEDSP